MNDLTDFLRNVSFFSKLNREDILTIQKFCTTTDFPAGEIIFLENDPADRFYIILDGEVEVWKAYNTADADILAVQGKGKLFGEMALVDRLPRSATVITRKPTKVLYIGEQDFQRLLSENSAIALSIVQSLSSVVRKSNDSFLEDLKQRNQELELAYKELKELQEEMIRQERLSNLGKFSSMILHDIRNPISTAKAYLELVEMSCPPETKNREYLKNIHFEIDRLNSLANEFLDYSRGEIRLNMNVLSSSDFVNQLKEIVERRMSSKNITMTFRDEYQGLVMMDKERMFRVLFNLADNARKAMNRNGNFSIIVVAEDQNLHFTVADDGEGMSEETLEHIFEPFYSSSGQGGTGLGMAIVKNIVEAHQGSLTIQSKVGVGTTIKLSIPLRL